MAFERNCGYLMHGPFKQPEFVEKTDMWQAYFVSHAPAGIPLIPWRHSPNYMRSISGDINTSCFWILSSSNLGKAGLRLVFAVGVFSFSYMLIREPSLRLRINGGSTITHSQYFSVGKPRVSQIAFARNDRST